MSKMEVSHNDEIEQRYIIDPKHGLYLPASGFHVYHQAEIGSGTASAVIEKFQGQTESILNGKNTKYREEFSNLFSTISPKQRVKLRIRIDSDPMKRAKISKFTLKEKLSRGNAKFKQYREHDIVIPSSLAEALITHIAPRVEIAGNPVEHGVLKHRYHVVY